MNMEKNIVIENATGLNGTEQESIYRSVQAITQTRIGSCPFHRNMGVEKVIPDNMSAVARNEYASGIIQAVPLQDSRIAVKEVIVESETTGKVVVEYV